jgi:hypothetical protein
MSIINARMNYPARICDAIISKRLSDYEAIREAVGLSDRNFELMVGRLCGKGAIRQDGETLVIHSLDVARATIDGAALPVLDEPKRRTGPAPKPTLAEADLDIQVRLKPRGQRPDLPSEIRSDAMLLEQTRKRRHRIILDTRVDIEHDVKPSSTGGIHAVKRVWPFDRMKVNASFAVQIPLGFSAKSVIQTLKRDVAEYAKAHPGFKTLIQTEVPVETIEATKVRLWVIALGKE